MPSYGQTRPKNYLGKLIAMTGYAAPLSAETVASLAEGDRVQWVDLVAKMKDGPRDYRV